MPSWYPFIGNYLSLSKAVSSENTRGTGKNVLAIQAEEHLKDGNGIFPYFYTTCPLTESGGVLVITNAESMDRMLTKGAD